MLPASIFSEEDVVLLAQYFLGKLLVTYLDGVLTSGRIVETEAYRGPEDQASHAYANKKTQRTRVMFEEGGKAYVYLCYGIHHLFNVVTGKAGVPHAVLVRAVEPVENVEVMLKRRRMEILTPRLTAGPGVLSQALGIQVAFSGVDMRKMHSHVWLEDRGEEVGVADILSSARVGVEYAKEHASLPWRFRIKDCRWTSPAP